MTEEILYIIAQQIWLGMAAVPCLCMLAQRHSEAQSSVSTHEASAAFYLLRHCTPVIKSQCLAHVQSDHDLGRLSGVCRPAKGSSAFLGGGHKVTCVQKQAE